MTQPHVLVVSATDSEHTDYRNWDVECPGVTDDCRGWLDCREPGCNGGTDPDGDDEVVHGVEHRWLGCWCVRTDECFIATYIHLADAADEAGLTEPGRYLVRPAVAEDLDHTTLRLELASEGGGGGG